MDFHPAANIFPMMTGEEYANLVESIRQNGQRIPILLFENKILDGRNRYAACQELGIEPRCEQWTGDDPWSYVFDVNAEHRFLEPMVKSLIHYKMVSGRAEWQEEQRKRREEAQKRERNSSGVFIPTLSTDNARDNRTHKAVSKKLKVSQATAARAQALFNARPDLADKVINREMKFKAADHERKRTEYISDLEAARSYTGQLDMVICGDMATVCKDIPDGSVDLILTDPPYPETYLPLFGELSKVAARVLRPGGLCAVYSGQIFLPQVLNHLSSHLEYVWTMAIRHTGGSTRMFKVHMNNGWKPVFLYAKPPFTPWWDSFIDITSGSREKDLHEWQQAESEAAYFIEHLSPPNGIVLDPFCGSGTTLSAAQKIGRRFIGIDIDQQSVSKSLRRVNHASGRNL